MSHENPDHPFSRSPRAQERRSIVLEALLNLNKPDQRISWDAVEDALFWLRDWHAKHGGNR